MRRVVRSLIGIAGLAAIGYMVWGLVFSEHGYLVYREELARFQELQDEVVHLKQQREQLARQILSLRNDPEALEELVHRELGYVHQDEFMLIMPEHDKNTKGAAKP